MILDFNSFALGVFACALLAGGWYFGQQSAIRTARRIVRHRGNLDLVYWEDAIRDDSIHKPQASTAELTPFTRDSQR